MWYEEKFIYLKDHFTFSVYDICTTKIVLKEEAFINPTGSLIEQIDLFEYSKDDINDGINILDELIDKIAVDEKAFRVLGCELPKDCDVVHEVRCDIHSMFYKLQRNYNDIASSKDDTKRKLEYERLLKGFRLITEILKNSCLSLDVVAAGIITIREASKHCMSNWKLTLIGLMISFESQIKNVLEQRGINIKRRKFINDEEDKIYELLINAFYCAKNSITSNLISDFIKKSRIFEGGETHYRDICTNFLNKKYNMNLPELNDISENLFSSTLIASIEYTFEKYIQDINIYDLIFDKATKNCIEDIVKYPHKINQIMDWFYMYLEDKNMKDLSKDATCVYDFVERYITCGEYSCKLRYAALKEIMIYYGFIEARVQSKINFREDRIVQKLLDIEKNNDEDKKKFKKDILGVLSDEVDPLIKFMVHPAVKTYNMFSIEDIKNIFIDKSSYDEWLLLASMYGNEDVAKYLVENGADINSTDRYGYTVFMYGCESGNKILLKYLLENGVDLSKEDNIGRTALMIASSKNYCDIVTYLLEIGVDVNKKDCFGWSPIIIACNNNNIELVAKLVENGADVNAVGEELCTALMYACDRNNIDIVRYLVENGADVSKKNIEGYTALLIACGKNNIELVKYLVKHGADINYENYNKCTALMIACEQNDIELVKYLVESGANVNKENIEGWTALLVATRSNNELIVRYLVENGACLNKENRYGDNALLYACENDNITLAIYLIKCGIDVNKYNENKKTALIIACENNNTKLVMYLVEHGASINHVDARGCTALSIACKNNNVNLIKYLIENFAAIGMLSRENKFKINLLMCNSKTFKTDISVDIQHSIQSGNIDRLTKCLDRYIIELVCNKEIKLWEIVNCMNYLDNNQINNESDKEVRIFKKYILEHIKRNISNNMSLSGKRVRCEVERKKDKYIKLK